MSKASIDTPALFCNPNFTPPIIKAISLGIQHVLGKFVSNMMPAIIICGAAGFGFGSNSPDFPQMIYMIQMSMILAGIAALFQTIGFGPVGAPPPMKKCGMGPSMKSQVICMETTLDHCRTREFVASQKGYGRMRP